MPNRGVDVRHENRLVLTRTFVAHGPVLRRIIRHGQSPSWSRKPRQAARQGRTMRERRLPVFGALAAGVAALVSFATALPVGAATVVATQHSCTATALGQSQTTTQNDNVDVTAPSSASSGSQFQVVLAPEAQTAPSSAGNFTIVSIKNATLRITVGNATVVGTPTLSGG